MPEHIVELKPRPRGRVTVRLTGGRFFTVPLDQTRALSVGTTLSDGEISRLDRIDQFFRGKSKAMLLLSKRARTRAQIKTALEKLSIEPSIRDGILSELIETGLVDDRRFAREFVQLKSEVRGFGPHRLRRDLTRLGVGSATVNEVLDGSFDSEKQTSMARELALRRAGDGSVDEKTARRIADLLRRKGFDFEVVNHVIYELLHRREDGGALE
jgi:SOS response regulatory protein OraA/RecX